LIAVLDLRGPGVAESIHRVHVAAYAVEQELIGAENFPPLRITPDDIRQEPETFLGYHEGDALLGVVSFQDEPGRLLIGRLVVDPGHHGRGIGQALLLAVERRAPGGAVVEVSTAEKNPPAVALYTKNGYAAVDRRVLEGITVVLFRKEFPAKRYRLLGPEGPYFHDDPGLLGGHTRYRIYGLLSCSAPKRGLEAGTYQKHRVFFADEDTAIATGFRPCSYCLPDRYRLWKSGGEPGSVSYPWLILPPSEDT